MNLSFQSVGSRGSRAKPALRSPMWARWLVLAFALVFGGITTAQAAHLHRPAEAGHHLQGPLAGSPNADTEEHCPLCVAIHPAMPVPMHVEPAPVAVDEQAEGRSQAIAATMAWHFARFSRPPPVLG